MVYIPPASPRAEMTMAPSRNKMGASRKTLEIFEDRIFHDPTDGAQLRTPGQTLRQSKSFQEVSRSAPTGRNCKPLVDGLGAAKPCHRTNEQEQNISPTQEPSLLANHLRRRQTVQDLRIADKALKGLDRSNKSSLHPGQCKSMKSIKQARLDGIPLVPRKNQKEAFSSDSLPTNFSKNTTRVDKISPSILVSPNRQSSKKPLPPDQENLERRLENDMKPYQELTETSHRSESMPDIRDINGWDLHNVNDWIVCPDDFCRPFIRSDARPTRDLYSPVARISVTTSWKDISPARAKELFRIHTVFQDALKSLLINEVQSMLTTVRKRFHQKEGNFDYVDGLRVDTEYRWTGVDREELVNAMMTRDHGFFFQRGCQKRRSALVQLYLSSLECFMTWEKYHDKPMSSRLGLELRTTYDQLSTFERPSVSVGTFCDYLGLFGLNFLSVNRTPREDEELIIVPKYNLCKADIQTTDPIDVTYWMADRISWLFWDDEIQGFRGRVPTYSVFLDNQNMVSNGDCDDFISHTLEITICASFRKYPTIGDVHFQRLVRAPLTLQILCSKASIDINGLFGTDQGQRSMETEHGGDFGRTPVPASYGSARYGDHVRPMSPSSAISNFNNEHLERHRPCDILLPKNLTRSLCSPLRDNQKHHQYNASDLPLTFNSVVYPSQDYMQDANGVSDRQESAQKSVSRPRHAFSARASFDSGNCEDAPYRPWSPQDKGRAYSSKYKAMWKAQVDDYLKTSENCRQLNRSVEARLAKMAVSPASERKVGSLSESNQSKFLPNASKETQNILTRTENGQRYSTLPDDCLSTGKQQMVYPHRQSQIAPHKHPSSNLATGSSSKTSPFGEQAQGPCPYRINDTNFQHPVCPSSVLGQSAAVEKFNATINSLDIVQSGNVNTGSTYATPPLCSPDVSLADCDSRRENDVQRELVAARLTLEEEIAVLEAMNKCYDDEMQRKMANQGFKFSFDDIFNDESLDQDFGSESPVEDSQVQSESIIKKTDDETLKDELEDRD